tara:strand:- start:223 stop:624 length:402 start_codon:yes stop_codon:yes gene_type:complete
VFEKDVRHATIRARHIVVRGDVSDVEPRSDLGVEIHDDLRDSLVSLGYRTGEIQDLNRQRVEMQASEKELSELEVRVGAGARSFARDYPQVNLQLGSILIPNQRELKVDLRSFYDALGERGNVDPEKPFRSSI